MAESTKGSNYVWWALFTGSVISGFVLTLCLDGFFGSTKTQETLTYGVRGCAPGLMRDLGFGVSGMPENVGLPRIDYIDDAISFAEVVHGNTHPEDDRDRRSVDLVASDDTVDHIFGANFSASGPVPGNKGCFQMLKDYAEFLDDNTDATERLEWWENADNKPMQLLMCIAASKCSPGPWVSGARVLTPRRSLPSRFHVCHAPPSSGQRRGNGGYPVQGFSAWNENWRGGRRPGRGSRHSRQRPCGRKPDHFAGGAP